MVRVLQRMSRFVVLVHEPAPCITSNSSTATPPLPPLRRWHVAADFWTKVLYVAGVLTLPTAATAAEQHQVFLDSSQSTAAAAAAATRVFQELLALLKAPGSRLRAVRALVGYVETHGEAAPSYDMMPHVIAARQVRLL